MCMKDSFILYTKYKQQIKRLDMEQRGILFTAILMHESGEELPEMDVATSMAFDFISVDLKENAYKYEETCKKNAENGRKGGRPKKQTVTEETEKTDRFSENRPQAKKADNENDIDNDLKEKTSLTRGKRERFVPPTVEEVEAYCLERKNGIDAEAFVAFYDSKGWKVGKDPMKNWKSAVITWEKKRKEHPIPSKPRPINKFQNFPQRSGKEENDANIAKLIALQTG